MSHKFNSENQPDFEFRARRGKDKRTLILDALKESGRLSLPPDADRDDIERAWFAKIAAVALDDEHKDSGMCKQALLDRGWAKAKPESNPIPFSFDINATPTENVKGFMLDASEARIPIEDAGRLIAAMKDMLLVHEQTDIIERFEQMAADIEKLKNK